MKKKKWLIVLVVTIIILALVIGIPLGINELYKKGSGYITVWDGADVLSFYGTILGSTITIIALIVTLISTRKQIQRERFLERNQIKWEKVESIITQALINISPLQMQESLGGNAEISTMVYVSTVISRLQSYAAKAKSSLDLIYCYVDPTQDYYISDYLNDLNDAIKQFCEIETQLERQYTYLQSAGATHHGVIPDSAILLCLQGNREIMQNLRNSHSGTYQDLLNKKRSVFEKIYTEIDLKANHILEFRKEKGDMPCPPLNGSEKKK